MRRARTVLLALLGLAGACGGTTYEGGEAPTTPTIAAERAMTEPPPIARLNELERQCRSQIPAETFQEAAKALSVVRASIGRLCSIELVGDGPLEWRVSCGSDDFFGSGQHSFSSPTHCDGGTNAFECLGHGLQSMIPHAEHIDVAVVGHVDLELPADQRLRCDDLTGSDVVAWDQAPWSGNVTRDREQANARLAWCRAARATAAVRAGLGATEKARLVAVGAGASWLAARLDRSAEVPTCPGTTTAEDDATVGRCQSARRVDLLVRLAATASATGTSCSRENFSSEGALFCLEECLARPERSTASLTQSMPFFDAGGERSVTPRAGFFLARSRGAPGVEVDRVLDRLGLR